MPHRPAVLLVDDRPENLVALRAVLEPLPCRLVTVTSGEDALKALLQDDFAVVLLDVQMPGMDGFETAELIKGRERTRTLPIIFVTAISKETHHVFRGYSAGAVDYVFKPYDPTVLRSKVSVFLDLDAKSRAAAHSEAVIRAAFNAAPIGMARLDVDGRIAEANEALSRLVDQTAVDLRDRPLESLVDPSQAAAVSALRSTVIDGAGEARAASEVRVVSAAGEEIPCEMQLSLVLPEAGVPEGLVVQFVDLRERERAEAEREHRRRERIARHAAERTAERLRAIQGISDAALGTLSFDALVRQLLERTIEALGVDTAAIVLEDRKHLVVHQAAHGSGATALTERRVPRDPALAAAAGILGSAVASSLSAPLDVDGHPIGALHVGTLFARRFTPDDAALLDLAADRAAIGLQRAQLYAREHRIAEELQRSLLPAELPEVAGMKAAARYFAAGAGTQVGGDWYDAVVGPDGRLLLIIGDVAGRGIVAASAMGQLRSAARAYALDGLVPGALLERLNAFQISLHNRGMTTISVVSVDPASGEVRYAKAGHPPPLLVHARGDAEWLDRASGPPLGAVDGASYREGTVRLDPGGVLLLYTDGLVEVRGEALDEGFERLKAAAVAAQVPEDIDRVCDVVLEHTLLNPAADDDVTLLVLGAAGERDRPADAAFPHRRDESGRLLAKGRWPHQITHAARVELPAGHLAGSVARRAVDEALSDVSSPAELADLRIIVAEVVNNAIIHGELAAADGPVVMHVAAAPDAVRVEITNPGPPFEIGAPSPREEPGGFGLVIVDRLSTRWGVENGDDICVWFEIEREREAGAAAAR